MHLHLGYTLNVQTGVISFGEINSTHMVND